ncbi:MAG: hypothetical protein IKY61_02955, partial [Thermoguttaceae bacterium]|nr:hypothetical protein [Thermoguttaceae bacterium]
MTTQRKKRAAIARAFLGFSLLYAVGCAEKEENFPKIDNSEAQAGKDGENKEVAVFGAEGKQSENTENRRNGEGAGENAAELLGGAT